MARIFVTGSADGLGLATARTLLDDGHGVVAHVRNADRLAAVRDSWTAARTPSRATWPTSTRRATSPPRSTGWEPWTPLVHFTPGARTAWHTHPHGQTIFVTEGVGPCQREGGQIEAIRPGDRVLFESGENHWVTWGGHVTDDQYSAS